MRSAHSYVTNDDSLRRKVAQKWSELNGVDITPEMINCLGCHADGVKTPYCESMCPIHQCVQSNGYVTCAECSEMEHCEKLAPIRSNAEAVANLEEIANRFKN